MKLTVDLGPNSYPIHIENGILAKTGELVSEVFSGRKLFQMIMFFLSMEKLSQKHCLTQGLNATLLFCLTANLLRVSSLCLRSMKH